MRIYSPLNGVFNQSIDGVVYPLEPKEYSDYPAGIVISLAKHLAHKIAEDGLDKLEIALIRGKEETEEVLKTIKLRSDNKHLI